MNSSSSSTVSAVDTGLVSKTGTWFTYGEVRLGQGRENAKAYLEEHGDTMHELESRIRGTWEATPTSPVTVGAGANGANGEE